MKPCHLIIVLIINYLQFHLCSTSCKTSDLGNTYKQNFATKTGYANALKDNSFQKEYEEQISGCDASMIWFFTRHGTRYPLKADIEEFAILPILVDELVFNHFQGRGCLSEKQVYEFKKWTRPYELRDQGELHSTGAEELYDIGKYWAEMFPHLLSHPYDAEKVKVEFSVTNRTGQSAYHFLRGAFGDDEIGNIKLPKPFSPNFIVKFHKACPRWMTEVYKNNKTTYKERNLFVQTPQFQNMVKDVSARLGYNDDLISTNKIVAMYDECRYESAWFPDNECIWCDVFSTKDLEILEYYQDLKYYYEDSYGTPMNTETACKAASDLYKRLRMKVKSPGVQPQSVLYFSHDKAVLQLQALLGLFKPDLDLRHDNFDSNRKYKTSTIGGFSTNLGFVLYKCGEQHKVGLLFNGNPLPVPSICSSPVCDWTQYEAFLRPIVDNCDFNKLCHIRDEL